MKTIPISRRARSLYAVLDSARQENLILALPDGTEFILAEIDSFDREIEVTRQNQQLMSLLEERSKQTKRVSLIEAKKLLGLPTEHTEKKKRHADSAKKPVPGTTASYSQ
jgi:hypothetical protein